MVRHEGEQGQAVARIAVDPPTTTITDSTGHTYGDDAESATVDKLREHKGQGKQGKEKEKVMVPGGIHLIISVLTMSGR